jgi:glycosyltransferase involved in cell wall biosynthesis
MIKLFIAVSPGFYKTNLFNELSKIEKIKVVYTGSYDKSSRNKDFLSGEKKYNYVNITGSKIVRLFKTIRLLITEKTSEVIIGGYDNLFCWIPLFVVRKKKCSLIVESTFRETNTSGIRFLLKKIFVNRINKAYAPGTPHSRLLRDLGFEGEIRIWKSVGLINVVPQPPYRKRKIVKNFLFVGRLIPVKNLPWLIDKFTKHQELNLTIIGFGVQEKYLKSLVSTDNIRFVGSVDNSKLSSYYQSADVLILPSLTETWGLVIEEALNNGTPVLCSHMVGCADDLITAKNNGVVFQLNNDEDFEEKLSYICNVDNYNILRRNVSMMDFKKYEKQVVDAFVD